MSVKLCSLSLSMPQKVKFYGLTRPLLKVLPSVSNQEDEKKKKYLESVHYTVKVEVLKGVSSCNNIACITFYYTKTVYFLSGA